MTWYSGLAIYMILWWLVLFTMLPLGRRSMDSVEAADVVKGHDSGAPQKPWLPLKMLATTVISGILFAAFWWAWTHGWINIRPD